jgi:hypothetical protein
VPSVEEVRDAGAAEEIGAETDDVAVEGLQGHAHGHRQGDRGRRKEADLTDRLDVEDVEVGVVDVPAPSEKSARSERLACQKKRPPRLTVVSAASRNEISPSMW